MAPGSLGWAAVATTYQDSFVRELLQLPVPWGVEDHWEGLVWRLNVAQLHLILQRRKRRPLWTATALHPRSAGTPEEDCTPGVTIASLWALGGVEGRGQDVCCLEAGGGHLSVAT